MKIDPTLIDSFILDTYKVGGKNVYLAGAITFLKRKKIQAVRWKNKTFQSQYKADAFVRDQFQPLKIEEKQNEGELAGSRRVWGTGFYEHAGA